MIRINDEENFLLSLEDIAHSNKERVISLEKNVLLETRRLNLVILNNDIFPE